MGFQITGNTFIDSTRSAIFNANTTVANNFTVQITDRTVYIPTNSPMQGSVAGFSAGGTTPTNTDTVDKFVFNSDAVGTDVGNLSTARGQMPGQSSSTDGYVAGGFPPAAPTDNDTIDKFSFTSFTTATDIGNLTVGRRLSAGQSSPTEGFTSGGYTDPGNSDVVDKFPFSSDTGASDAGDLTAGRYALTGHSSTTTGYVAGGNPGKLNTIEKFAFSSFVTASDVGDLTQGRGGTPAGQSSKTHGYTAGGNNSDNNRETTIDKYPFATDTNASSVGNLLDRLNQATGHASQEYGYTSCGATGHPAPSSTVRVSQIQRFTFASDEDSVDVSNLTQARNLAAGQQD